MEGRVWGNEMRVLPLRQGVKETIDLPETLTFHSGIDKPNSVIRHEL